MTAATIRIFKIHLCFFIGGLLRVLRLFHAPEEVRQPAPPAGLQALPANETPALFFSGYVLHHVSFLSDKSGGSSAAGGSTDTASSDKGEIDQQEDKQADGQCQNQVNPSQMMGKPILRYM